MHLFIEMPADAVDVNVHPTKAEVRFREQSLVHEVVRRGLMDALGQGGVPQLQLQPEVAVQAPVRRRVAARRARRRRLSESLAARFRPSEAGRHCRSGRSPLQPVRPQPARLPSGPSCRTPAPTIKPMIPLGQFRDTFIIAIDDEGVAIIDQHVAHERVLFERVMERLTAGRLESQGLLVPMVLDVSAAEHESLVGARGGARAVRVRARELRRRRRST